MDSHEQSQDARGTTERLTARFALLWAEYRRLAALAEQWSAIESSTAWALVQHLVRWRQRLAPAGSRRQKFWRFLLRGLVFWRREKLEKPAPSPCEACHGGPTHSYSPALPTAARAALLTSTESKIRVAYIGSLIALDAATMRYRAYNLIEALNLKGLEGTFVPQEEIHAQLPSILSHDLIVLVRRMRDDALTTLIGLARRRGLPIVYDIDDYIFDPWVMPYVEAFQHTPDQAKVLRFMDDLGACLDQCDYFTGSTPYLAEKAAELGKESFVIHNGLNTTQLLQSQLACERRRISKCGPYTRIGYFSGTRTHQADFRVVYPALMRLLREERNVRLVIAGHLDVGVFPGLAPFRDQIDLLPARDWRELPAVMADVDINIIPLELTPFNEGKSNLKYFEAGLVGVPSVASPTRILCDSILHGHNGLLARTPEEWYGALKELVARPDCRRQMGQNALEHVLEHYTPAAIGAEAAAVYRRVLERHRTRRDDPKPTLKIVLLAADHLSKCEEILRQGHELAAAGHLVTVCISPSKSSASAAALAQSLSRRFVEPLFAVQQGGEVPCCDVLIAIDSQAMTLAKDHRHRAHLTIAEEKLLSMIQGAGRGLESLLYDWIQNDPVAPAPSRAA
jgi:glycosyltransferase involved in cell wall biosynthesis